MKSATAGPGRVRISYTQPLITSLLNKSMDIRISVDGKVVLSFLGTSASTTANPVTIQSEVDLPQTSTIRMDVLVAGAAIAANREGTLTITAA